MKLLRVFVFLLFVAGFSACEIQGEVHNTMRGTPTKADTVLPAKFHKYQEADSVKKAEENFPNKLRR